MLCARALIYPFHMPKIPLRSTLVSVRHQASKSSECTSSSSGGELLGQAPAIESRKYTAVRTPGADALSVFRRTIT